MGSPRWSYILHVWCADTCWLLAIYMLRANTLHNPPALHGTCFALLAKQMSTNECTNRHQRVDERMTSVMRLSLLFHHLNAFTYPLCTAGMPAASKGIPKRKKVEPPKPVEEDNSGHLYMCVEQRWLHTHVDTSHPHNLQMMKR